MLTLALDTAGVDRTTVALISGQSYLAGGSAPLSPAECLVPLVAEVLADVSTDMANIDRVVVGVGPGPFTGLRIGLAHAHSMAHALGITVRGVSSLAAVAAAHQERLTVASVAVATDARRKEVYCALLSDGRVAPKSTAVMSPADAASRYRGHVVVGDGAAKYREVFIAQGCTVLGVSMADQPDYARGLALAVLAADAADDLCDPLPDYLREPDAVPSVAAAQIDGRSLT